MQLPTRVSYGDAKETINALNVTGAIAVYAPLRDSATSRRSGAAATTRAKSEQRRRRRRQLSSRLCEATQSPTNKTDTRNRSVTWAVGRGAVGGGVALAIGGGNRWTRFSPRQLFLPGARRSARCVDGADLARNVTRDGATRGGVAPRRTSRSRRSRRRMAGGTLPATVARATGRAAIGKVRCLRRRAITKWRVSRGSGVNGARAWPRTRPRDSDSARDKSTPIVLDAPRDYRVEAPLAANT